MSMLSLILNNMENVYLTDIRQYTHLEEEQFIFYKIRHLDFFLISSDVN